LLLAAAILAVVILRIVRGMKKPSATQRSVSGRRQGPFNGADSEWYRLEKELARHQANREPAMTPLTWYQQAAILFPRRECELSEIIGLHYRLRFDPHGLS